MRHEVMRIADGRRSRHWDHLAAEEPLEIRIGGVVFSVTMRSPGNDFELVAGLLFSEGVVVDRAELRAMRYCAAEESPPSFNVVDVDLSPAAAARAEAMAPRRVATTSACGLCGAASIDAVRRRVDPAGVAHDPLTATPELLAGLPATLRGAQARFERTGGTHAAGLFDAAGSLVCAREDVGRHNAFDKVIGWALVEERLPLTGHMLLASGRASFELVQKALLAGVPLLAAVSAPSSLAVALAAEAGMTLVGFLRGPTMNVYTGAHRTTAPLSSA